MLFSFNFNGRAGKILPAADFFVRLGYNAGNFKIRRFNERLEAGNGESRRADEYGFYWLVRHLAV